MLNEAIRKINIEVGEGRNAQVNAIGNFLYEYLNNTDSSAAEKILAENKTIKGAINELRKEAKKNVVDGMGFLTDSEAFELVLKYFEIEAVEPEQEDKEFSVELDDLL